MRRTGFSLIELVAALTAATLLLVALASSVVISTSLLDSPPDDGDQRHDRLLADRLVADLRYATDIESTDADWFRVARPNPATGNSEIVTYASAQDGFRRQVDGGTPGIFDSHAATHAFEVDRYIAPPQTTPEKTVRLRSTSKSASFGAVGNLEISLPPGRIEDDLLLMCVAAKSPSAFSVSQPGWQTVSVQGIDDLRMLVLYRFADAGIPDAVTVEVFPDSSIAAVALCIENVNRSNVITWSDSRGGYGESYSPSTHPRARESASITSGQMNLQIFARDDGNWSTTPLGIASFAEADQMKSLTGFYWLDCSIGVAVRSGPMPAMTTTPRLWQYASGYWLQLSLHLGAAP